LVPVIYIFFFKKTAKFTQIPRKNLNIYGKMSVKIQN